VFAASVLSVATVVTLPATYLITTLRLKLRKMSGDDDIELVPQVPGSAHNAMAEGDWHNRTDGASSRADARSLEEAIYVKKSVHVSGEERVAVTRGY